MAKIKGEFNPVSVALSFPGLTLQEKLILNFCAAYSRDCVGEEGFPNKVSLEMLVRFTRTTPERAKRILPPLKRKVGKTRISNVLNVLADLS